MQFLKKLLFQDTTVDGLKLMFDKQEQYWKVKQDGSVVYLGTKEQCEKYISHQRGLD